MELENNEEMLEVIPIYRLSILICALTSRTRLLERLLRLLQAQRTPEIEILTSTDSGQLTTGTKRNHLLNQASGEYIAFIDDDDLVSDDYISKILEAIKTNPDCCGIEGLITFKRKSITRKFIHSIKYGFWYTNDNVYYRYPNHLSPVRRELALQVKFPDQTVGEDRVYSDKLFPLLQTEVYIDGPIYYYLTI